MGREGAGAPDSDVTDLEGLPPAVRYSMWVLRLCDRWKQPPSVIEGEPQEAAGHLEHEQIVLEALKRYS
jgi:hypothetical protein